ncbi:MAG: TrmH family RNA methyltransferase, partial [Sandaracinaceae bacterium]
MKREHPDVVAPPGALPELPAPAETIVELLSPLVTPQRLARMQSVVARRSRALVPVLEDLADPHNGAAVLRSADAFGCQTVHAIEAR